jgi:hypothetical protein
LRHNHRGVRLPGTAHLIEQCAEVIERRPVEREHLIDAPPADVVELGVSVLLPPPRGSYLVGAAIPHGLGNPAFRRNPPCARGAVPGNKVRHAGVSDRSQSRRQDDRVIQTRALGGRAVIGPGHDVSLGRPADNAVKASLLTSV